MKLMFLLVALGAMIMSSSVSAANPVVEMKTSFGVIEIELFEEKSPITVKNFLTYVDGKHYDGLIFHRVIDGFMIQGGGFDKDMKEKKGKDPIKNEAVASGLKNDRGTIAMARTPAPDSATNQFFINVKDNNASLDPSGRNPAGYAVFGRVIKGMDVVDKIKAVKTTTKGDHDDVPLETVTIDSVTRKKE
jgi:cyclophilin family peptidyl-prolyl cis-trans isomerase